MRIGVLSDTHGLLRPEAERELGGCALLLHGGDIGGKPLFERLERIAPVVAVRGNADIEEELAELPEVKSLELEGIRILMAHKRRSLPADTAGYDLVITGHTHRYAFSQRGRTRFLNPGSCGPRRPWQEITLAILEVRRGEIEVRRVDIRGQEEARTVPEGEQRAAVERILPLIRKNRSVEQIERDLGLPHEMVEQVVRIYFTHPGVDIEGILRRMGL